MRRPYDFFGQHFHRKLEVCYTNIVRRPCDARTAPVRCPYDMSTGYGLTIFKSLYNFLFYKIVEATEAVKSYDHRTAVATAAQRPYDNGLTGIARAP